MLREDVTIQPQLLSSLPLETSSQIVLFSDHTIHSLYGSSIPATLSFIIPPGESQKTLRWAESCWKQMTDYKIHRNALFLTLGGGVIGDLGGFIASTYARGMPLVHCPTTLLSMIDSSIGGKTGVNFGSLKNQVGTFYPAREVWIDPLVLKTLPSREFRAGLAELIKYGLIDGASFFDWIEEHMQDLLNQSPSILTQAIEKSIKIKQDIVQQDSQDLGGQRWKLNLGHTFAHAIESVHGFERYLHGEAVALGLICATQVSASLGLCHPDLPFRVCQLCQKAGLPTALLPSDPEQLWKFMKRDKKTQNGDIHFVLVEDFASLKLTQHVPKNLVMSSLLDLQNQNRRLKTYERN